MARKIDFSKALSPEEQAYVADRPWLLQDAKLRGEDIITDDEFVVDDEDQDDETGADGAEGSEDSSEDADSENTEEDEDGDQGDADEDSEDGEDDEEDVAPYNEWEYQELKDEAKRRELSAGGSKEQLIQRLQEDDNSDSE